MNFVDTHCHIIPGVDDGPPDMDTSIEMGRLAAADGITTIVATPHIIEGVYDGADIRERVAHLQSCFSQNGIGIKLVAGAEIPLSLCFTGNKEALADLTIGDSDFLLMETYDASLNQLTNAVCKVRLCGLYPILAHPERTVYPGKNLDSLVRAVAGNDVFIQITAAGIEGGFGKKIQRRCMDMLKSGMVQLVASDAHSGNARPPALAESFRILSDSMGSKAARTIMVENPGRVLGNMKPATVKPRRAPRRRFFSSLLGE